MKNKTSITSSLSNKGALTDAQVNAGFGFNTILESPDLNGQLYDIDSQVNIITKELCNFLTDNGITLNSSDNTQLKTLMTSLLSAKQNTLVAGAGITIDGNGVISAQASTPANIPLFYCAWLDSLPFNVSWVNASNYSWLYGSTYVGAYNRLDSQLNPVGTFRAGDAYYVCNFSDGSMQITTVPVNSGTLAQLESWCSAQGYTYSGATIEELECYKTISASSETIEGITITYYQTYDGKKIVTSDAEIANAESIYNITGVQWYYILDTVNQRFKLPRTKYGFTGLRDTAGKYVPESLPQHTHTRGTMNITGTATPSFNIISSYSGALYGTSASVENNRGWESSKSSTAINFDASRSWTGNTSGASGSTYQNNAPVQQRATQMYLYFYLGSADVEEIAEIAGIKAETINNKADTDLNNLSATGQKVIDGYPIYVDSLIFNTTAIGTYQVNLTSLIPQDGYSYECFLDLNGGRSDTSGTNSVLRCLTNFTGTLTQYTVIECDGVNFQQANGLIVIPVGTDRILQFNVTGYNFNNVSANLRMVRRIGTNT